MTSIIHHLLLYTMVMQNGRIKSTRELLTNVGESVATYKAMVTAPNFSEVVVSPNVLVFMKKHERKSYNLTINYKGNMERRVSSGSLVWVEDNGKHTVRSPIVVSPLVFALVLQLLSDSILIF